MLSIASLSRSPFSDRELHRAGVCCVNLASVYQRCPNIVHFAGADLKGKLSKLKRCLIGVKIGQISMGQTFVEWNNRCRSKFHDVFFSQW